MILTKKQIYVGFLVVFLVITLSGCNLFKKPNVVVEGLVTMGDGESALGPSKIYVNDEFKIETGKDGKFSLSLKPGEYTFYAEYNGKKSPGKSVKLSSKTASILLKIEGLGHLSGSVKTSDGLALSNATLKLGSLEIPLDEKGNYSMFVQPGNQELQVVYKGFKYTETYAMPEGNVQKDITISALANRNITVVDKSSSPQANITLDVRLNDYKDTVITDAKGVVSFIAPEGDANFTFQLPIPGSGIELQFAEVVSLGSAVELIADIANRLVFFDDFNSNSGKWELGNATIADGKVTSVNKAERGFAWLKSTELGTTDNYITVVKGIGSGGAFRVNAYVPDDLASLATALFRGYQSAIYVKGTSNSFQFSSFHGPGAPSTAPWWGHKRDLDFNNGLVDGDPKHPVVELGNKGYAYNPDVETVYAISIEETLDGNRVAIYLDGVELLSAVDSDATYEYPWGSDAFKHLGGGIFLGFEANATKDFNITEIAVYKIK